MLVFCIGVGDFVETYITKKKNAIFHGQIRSHVMIIPAIPLDWLHDVADRSRESKSGSCFLRPTGSEGRYACTIT